MKTPGSELSTELYVVLGSGGVGKTTSAAAMALRFAESGRRTLVITIDPAKRLAQALGLQNLSNEAQEVARFPNGATLSALWLDTSSAFDDLVRRHGSSLKNTEKILENRLFKIIKNQLGGVEEYLGLEQVLRLGRSGLYDVCVLDTPPSRHALDFLESPQHLLSFFDDSVVKVFMRGEEKEDAGFFKKLLNSGRQRALDTFKSFLGKTFLAELGDLLSNFEPVHRALLETAQAMESWVRSPHAHFVLVSLLENYPLDEVRLLSLELSARNLPPAECLVLNKCLPATPPPSAQVRNALGTMAGDALLGRYAAQRQLRQGLNYPRVVEVPRYSLKHLDLTELAAMGRIILAT